jgi:hypothetical protein
VFLKIISVLIIRDSEVGSVLEKIISSEGINLDEPANVFVGQDTRSDFFTKKLSLGV